MNLRIKSLALLLLLAAPALAQDKAKVPAELQTLVPTDAVVFAEIRSLEELAGLVGRVQGAATGKAPDVQQFLASLSLPGDASLIDPKGAFGFALRLSPQMPQPVPVLLIPTRDANAFAASVSKVPGITPQMVRASGAWVGVSRGAPLPAAGAASPLVAGLDGGLVTARVDLASILKVFRPLIDMGMNAAEQQIDQKMAEEGTDAAIDPREVVTLYFDFVRDFLDSAVTLDFALATQGPTAELHGSFLTKDGSPLAKWAKTEDVDFAAMASRLDANGALQFVGACDLASMMDVFLPMYESMIQKASDAGTLPAEVGTAFHAYLDAVKQILPLVNGCATSVDFGAAGMQGTVLYRSSDPQKVLQGFRTLLSNPAFASLGVQTSAAETAQRSGLAVTSWNTKFDPEPMLKLLGQPAGGDKALGAMRAVIAAMLGKDGLRFASAPTKEYAMCVVGGDEAFVNAAFARLASSSAAVPPALAGGVKRIAGCNPGFALHYDIGKVFGAVAAVAAATGEDAKGLQAFAGAALALDGWFGVDGATWRGGFSMDLDQLATFVKGMAANAQGNGKGD